MNDFLEVKNLIVVAPHPDDELIGCFELITRRAVVSKQTTVLYPNTTTMPTWTTFSSLRSPGGPLELLPVVGSDCERYLTPDEYLRTRSQFLFPDPVYETHPEHRRLGAVGEKLLREGVDVLFYSVNMQAPYIREVKNPSGKEQALDFYYSEKGDLWEWDHRYFLFEGQCRWVII